MRHYPRLGLSVLLWLLFVHAHAQFNVNSLFTPIDLTIPVQVFRVVSETKQFGIDTTDFEDPTMMFGDSLSGWRRWSYVENYAFGKDRGDLPMITDLNSLHPFFRDQVVNLIAKCKAKGINLVVVETYRTHAKQHEYKTMGKKYTSSGAGQSKHQYGLAVDVVPVVDSVAVWNNTMLWRKIGTIGEKLGLRWGGRWRKPYDPGHFEWTGGLTSYHLGNGKLPSLPNCSERYPCIEEDIKTLRRYWKEWEISQSALTRK
ncbi:MAG TPA: M15 family metallopeptidase [Chryseolinea sp.]